MRLIRILPVVAAMLIGSFAVAGPDQPLTLSYDDPADEWTEALPIGNGRLGAMVFGRPGHERLQLNEDTIWAGQPYEAARQVKPQMMRRIQQLIFDQKYGKAQSLSQKHILGDPVRGMAYQPLGDLKLTFPGHKAGEQYHHRLNLQTAIASTQYVHEGVTYSREVFASPVDEVIVVRVTADQPAAVSFKAAMATPQEANIKTIGTNGIQLKGVSGDYQGIEGKLAFAARTNVRLEGGTVKTDGDKLVVSGADVATLLIAADTSHNGPKDISGDPVKRVQAALADVAKKDYAALRRDHIKEHRRLFDRVSLSLGDSDEQVVDRPTDERLDRFDKVTDPQLARTFFQFGRYLMISSSRPGSQPANLQGIWNQQMKPPWESKYTININAEMNYWIAEAGNLAECHKPLIKLVRELSQTNGAVVAQKTYNADGWVAHHNTDLWRRAAPLDGAGWGQYQTGGAWLTQHLWWHYQYSQDEAYLAEVYPVFKGASRFFLETLVEHPKFGWLVTCPSNSPENKHPHSKTICAGPTVDMQIVHDLFTRTIKAARILGKDSGLRQTLKKTRERLAPMQVGQHGQLQEWLYDWDDPNDHHRHVSHLYGLHPGSLITPERTPKLAKAAKKSLQMRGDGGTGWAKAWKVNWWARLKDGNHAHKLLTDLVANNSLPNMFLKHPPFQIDGNFGGASGMIQMLLQSHSGTIQLLPALPDAWPDGYFEGLRARGSFEIDARWQDGQLKHVTIHSGVGAPCTVRYRDTKVSFETKAGQTIHLNGELERTNARSGS